MTTVAVRAPLGWFGPGRLVQDAILIARGGTVAFAGSRAELSVAAGGRTGPEDLSGRALPPQPEEEIVVDGFLMPGVVDRHVHIALSDPGAVVAGGVTAVRDLGWPADDIFSLAEASEGPSFNGPLIRATGPIITCPGGYPVRAGWGPEGTALQARDADEAAGAARSLLSRGAAMIKVALNADAGPTLSDDQLLAVCDAAHARGALVTAHVQGPGQAGRAAGAGVDEFAHCPWSERLSDDLVEAAAGRMRMVTTLDIHSFGRDTPELATAVDNLRRFVRSGGRVAYGTDLGNGAIPPGIHGREVEHMRRSGMSPQMILQAVTHRPLEPGQPADAVVLGDDATRTTDAFRSVLLVLRGGRRIG